MDHCPDTNTRVPSGIIRSCLNTSLNLWRWRLPEDERVAFRPGRTHRIPATINTENASMLLGQHPHTELIDAFLHFCRCSHAWNYIFLRPPPPPSLHTLHIHPARGWCPISLSHTRTPICHHSARISTRLQPVSAGRQANSFCSATYMWPKAA